MTPEKINLGDAWSVEVEQIQSGEARLARFCDHDWTEGTGDAPLCRRRATRRSTLRDSEGRLVVALECCDRSGCLRRDLDSHSREARESTDLSREARREASVCDVFDGLEGGLVDGEKADRLFADLDRFSRRLP